MPAKESVIAAASLCVVAALPGCSAARAARRRPILPRPPRFTPGPAPPGPRSRSPWRGTGRCCPAEARTRTRKRRTPRCDSATFAADKALGARVARAFALAGFPVSADLLAHFLAGKGTGVNYRAGSPIAKKALASEAFRALNADSAESDPRPAEGGQDPGAALRRAAAGGGIRVHEQRPVLGISRHAGLDRNRARHPRERTVRRNPLVRHTGQLRVPGRRHAGRVSARR